MKCPNEFCAGDLIKVDNVSKIGTSYQCGYCKERFCLTKTEPAKMLTAEYILERLREAGLEPYLYHTALTNSFYIKFQLEGLRSLRVSDHEGRKKYTYKWNLLTSIVSSHEVTDRGVKRFFYHMNDLSRMIEHMQNYKRYVLSNRG